MLRYLLRNPENHVYGEANSFLILIVQMERAFSVLWFTPPPLFVRGNSQHETGDLPFILNTRLFTSTRGLAKISTVHESFEGLLRKQS